MGHPPSEVMCSAISGPNPCIINSNLTPPQIRNVFNKENCITCILSKRNFPPPVIHDFQKQHNKTTTNIYHDDLINNTNSNNQQQQYNPGEYISVDPSAYINPTSIDNDKLFFLFQCRSTGYIWAIMSRSFDSKAYFEAVKSLLLKYNFQQSIIDNCLYYKITSTEKNFIIITYVDDIHTFFPIQKMEFYL
jgi:hypothetical protein